MRDYYELGRTVELSDSVFYNEGIKDARVSVTCLGCQKEAVFAFAVPALSAESIYPLQCRESDLVEKGLIREPENTQITSRYITNGSYCTSLVAKFCPHCGKSYVFAQEHNYEKQPGQEYFCIVAGAEVVDSYWDDLNSADLSIPPRQEVQTGQAATQSIGFDSVEKKMSPLGQSLTAIFFVCAMLGCAFLSYTFFSANQQFAEQKQKLKKAGVFTYAEIVYLGRLRKDELTVPIKKGVFGTNKKTYSVAFLYREGKSMSSPLGLDVSSYFEPPKEATGAVVVSEMAIDKAVYRELKYDTRVPVVYVSGDPQAVVLADAEGNPQFPAWGAWGCFFAALSAFFAGLLVYLRKTGKTI